MELKDLRLHRFNDYNLVSLVGEGTVNKYLGEFESEFIKRYDNSYRNYIEWMARSYRSSKHIVGAIIFFCQTRHMGIGGLANISSYSMYYSLFHAVSSVMVMMPHFSYDRLLRISHKNCLVWSETELGNRGLLPKDIKNLYNKLIGAREAFSYNIPLGCLRDRDLAYQFSLKDNFAGLEDMLPSTIQLANVLSHALYQLAPKQFSGLDGYKKYHENQAEADRIFFQVIEIIDRLGTSNEIDRDDYQRFAWLISKVKMPVPHDWLLSEKISEDLECSWWPLQNKNDFDIREVSRTLSEWLEG